ncbi:hypothetical protein DMENIID0001_127080 [Sergentomyia squamirostris]
MSTFFEEVDRCDESYEKAKYLAYDDYNRYGNFNLPVECAKKWSKTTYFLPSVYKRYMQRVENFEVRPDDVWVVTFPKCGTTWTQEMVWQICNNLDYAKGRAIGLNTRFPFLELGGLLPDENLDTLGILNETKSPRLIKSHLPAPLLPKQIWTVKPKIIYVARNAKDTLVSFYHHYRNLQGYKYHMDAFLEIFMKDFVIFTPYDTHILDFWYMRNEQNILFLTYEDMKKDHPTVIKKTAEFLGKPLSEEQILELTDHLSFDKMSKNESVDLLHELKDMQDSLLLKKQDEDFAFVRKGKVGAFGDDMTPAMIEEFNEWLKERLIALNVDSELWKIFFLQDKPKNM